MMIAILPRSTFGTFAPTDMTTLRVRNENNQRKREGRGRKKQVTSWVSLASENAWKVTMEES